jgi:hypothetical protein
MIERLLSFGPIIAFVLLSLGCSNDPASNTPKLNESQATRPQSVENSINNTNAALLAERVIVDITTNSTTTLSRIQS